MADDAEQQLDRNRRGLARARSKLAPVKPKTKVIRRAIAAPWPMSEPKQPNKETPK